MVNVSLSTIATVPIAPPDGKNVAANVRSMIACDTSGTMKTVGMVLRVEPSIAVDLGTEVVAYISNALAYFAALHPAQRAVAAR